MLLAGDELGRTQHGDENAYCRDDELSWLDWSAVDEPLLEFTRRLIRLRREEPAFRGRRWLSGEPAQGDGPKDVAWFRPDGGELEEEDWRTGFAKSLGVYLNGSATGLSGPRGEPILGESFFLIFNAHHEPLSFRLPGPEYATGWREILATRDATPREPGAVEPAGGEIKAEACSLVLLRRVAELPEAHPEGS
jgi:glycogen operon protein